MVLLPLLEEEASLDSLLKDQRPHGTEMSHPSGAGLDRWPLAHSFNYHKHTKEPKEGQLNPARST